MADDKPTQRIDRSRKEARWVDSPDGNSILEWYTDGKFVNVHSRFNYGQVTHHVNNWVSIKQLVAILQTIDGIVTEEETI